MVYYRNNHRYWFWNTKTQSPDYVWIKAKHRDTFEFNYQRKRYCVSYEYANGKLFARREDVPTPQVEEDFSHLDSTIDDLVDYDFTP